MCEFAVNLPQVKKEDDDKIPPKVNQLGLYSRARTVTIGWIVRALVDLQLESS